MPEQKQRYMSNGRMALWTAIVTAFFVAVATILNHLVFRDWLFFFLYQCLCIAVPGMALLRLLRIRIRNMLLFLGIGYAAGYCISVFTYIAAIPFMKLTDRWMALIPAFHYALAIAGSGYLVCSLHRHPLAFEKTETKEFLFFLGLLTGTFLLRFLCFGLPNRLPDCGSEQAYYVDTLYWLGNAISLSRGFPPESMRGAGEIISYHYFSSMQLVSIEKTTGVDIIALGLGYSYIQSTLLMTSALYCLFTELFDKRWKVLLGIVLLLLSNGYEEQTGAFISAHMLSGPFGFDLALGLSAIGLLLLVWLYLEKTLRFNLSLLFCLILATCIGTKGPIGGMLLVFEGVMCFNWLFDHRKRLRAIAFGLVSVIVCLLIYFTFMSAGLGWFQPTSTATEVTVQDTATTDTTDEPSSGLSITWKGTSQYSSLIRQWYYEGNMAMQPVLRVMFGLELGFTYAFYVHMALFFLLVCKVLVMLRYPKYTNSLQWCCLCLVIMGNLMSLFLSMVGNSQVYFVEASLLFMTVFAFYKAPREARLSKNIRSLKWVIATPLCVLCIADACIYNYPIVNDAIVTMQTGQAQITSRFDYNIVSNIVTPKEAQGYQWIRENTPEDAILISNATVNTRGSLKASVFTERRLYVESKAAPSVGRELADRRLEQIEEFYAGNIRAYKALVNNDVDYAIVLKRYETGDEYIKPLSCVYENPCVLE